MTKMEFESHFKKQKSCKAALHRTVSFSHSHGAVAGAFDVADRDLGPSLSFRGPARCHSLIGS